jgi:hypothetical protein
MSAAKPADVTAAAAPVTAAETPAMPLNRAGLLSVLALAALSDWLFYARASVGIALVVFAFATAAAICLVNRPRARSAAIILGGAALLAATLAPFAVSPSILSGLFALAGVAVFAVIIASGEKAATLTQRSAAAFRLVGDCGWRIYPDLAGELRRPRSRGLLGGMTLVPWTVPLLLGATFLALFAMANPLIERWLAALDPALLLDRLSFPRIAFWLIAASLVWPFLFVRTRPEQGESEAAAAAPTEAPAPPAPMSYATGGYLGHAAIVRSLLLFNALFALQSILDATYLWGGVELPEGMSHAEYAHRGAYPLIVTALLAAAFVVIALRPGSEASKDRGVRALVYLWVAQNVLLVLSSILRLDLYVETYSLTYWRIAAFVWMVIVAIGLVLIVVRIALDLPTRWLVAANAVTLAVALYACAYPNFPAIIADYNVRHSAELTGRGSSLDKDYLNSLGEHAIPALDLLLARGSLSEGAREVIGNWRKVHAGVLKDKLADWRAWSWWDWQLLGYVESTPAPAEPSRAPAQSESQSPTQPGQPAP